MFLKKHAQTRHVPLSLLNSKGKIRLRIVLFFTTPESRVMFAYMM